MIDFPMSVKPSMSLSASPPLREEIEAEKGHAASLATVLWNLTIASMKASMCFQCGVSQLCDVYHGNFLIQLVESAVFQQSRVCRFQTSKQEQKWPRH